MSSFLEARNANLKKQKENDEHNKKSPLAALRVGVKCTLPVAMSQQQSQQSVQAEAEFLDKLTAYHAERGYVPRPWLTSLLSLTRCSTRTILEPQPRVNGKQINLYKLFNDVVERGGYDVVSAEKLAWRKIGHEFGLGSANAAAYAFLLKSVYYNNLAYVQAGHSHLRILIPV